ncbi:MAG: TIGR04283 family arsenosugar biosynthesis glycosyltransferase [Verrucomicrobiota bacterium]
MASIKAIRSRVLFLGAGHAHLYSLARVESLQRRGAEVTVISPAPFWYSGMGPGLLSGQYAVGDASVDVRSMVEQRGARFIDGRATVLDAERKRVVVDSGDELFYDAMSINVGSEVFVPGGEGGGEPAFSVKPVSNFLEMRRRLLEWDGERPIRVVVVGGGAAGCEAAANVWRLCAQEDRLVEICLVTSDSRLLPNLPQAAANRMSAWFRAHGIVVEPDRRVAEFAAGKVSFEDGSRVDADMMIAATGVHPPPLLAESGLATDATGAMLVDEHLQSISHPGVFGGGDCIRFQLCPLDRVGVHAVREAPVLFRNVRATVNGRGLRTYKPRHRYLQVLNLGGRDGLLVRGRRVFLGRLAFRLKHWLDQRFISGYQRAVNPNNGKLSMGRSRQPGNTALILFARFPVAGQAKTRLIPALGPEGAARLHRRLAEHAANVARAARQGKASVAICFTGAARRDFRAWLGDDLRYVHQRGGDLGARMHHAFANAFDHGAERVLVVGTDVPDVSADLLRRAIGALDHCDGVLGPAADGGYYLIGLKNSCRELFEDIDWGTERVAEQTRAAGRRLGLKLTEMPELNDVDRPEDATLLRNNPKFADVFTDKPRLSVVIPTLNEAEALPQTLECARHAEDVEIIVADGGSRDDTRERAAEAGVVVLEVGGGRAAQLNAGAARATGRHLLFLHADTLLPEGYADTVRQTLENPAVVAGAFRFRTDGEGLGIRLVEWGTNLRSTAGGRPYGDQGLFLERRVFDELNGFPELPIMEDFEFVRRLRRRGRIVTVGDTIITSARRWRFLGPLRTTLRNQLVILGYRAGVPPERLARWYRAPSRKRRMP